MSSKGMLSLLDAVVRNVHTRSEMIKINFLNGLNKCMNIQFDTFNVQFIQ